MSPDIETASKSFRELTLHEQRRLIIKSPLFIGALLIIQACGGNSTNQESTPVGRSILVEQPLELPLIARQPRMTEVINDPRFDLDYVNKLLTDLKKPQRQDLDITLQALKQNVAYVQLLDEKGQARGEGTALKLDASGYYLTASHLLIEQVGSEFIPIKTKSQVYLPTLGILSPIKSMIFDPTSDLAIFYAPSGLNRKTIPGLQIVDSPLVPDQKLWQLGMVLEATQNSITAKLSIPFGKVDQNPNQKNYLGEERYILVRGMIPYGGSSGAPIIDSKGNIVAVESGFYIDPNIAKSLEKERSNYTHSMISPLANLDRLKSAQIHNFQK